MKITKWFLLEVLFIRRILIKDEITNKDLILLIDISSHKEVF